jgi:hypothetical protein
MKVAILPFLASGAAVMWPGSVSMSNSSGESSSSLGVGSPALHAQPHATHGIDDPMRSDGERASKGYFNPSGFSPNSSCDARGTLGSLFFGEKERSVAARDGCESRVGQPFFLRKNFDILSQTLLLGKVMNLYQ